MKILLPFLCDGSHRPVLAWVIDTITTCNSCIHIAVELTADSK